MNKEEKMKQIKLSFENLAQLFEVLGDQNRQHLIYTLFSLPCKSKGGVRVGEITEKTHLSRPTVSHHLKLLKQVGIVGMRQEGTKNFYYLETNTQQWHDLSELSQDIISLIQEINLGEEN